MRSHGPSWSCFLCSVWCCAVNVESRTGIAGNDGWQAKEQRAWVVCIVLIIGLIVKRLRTGSFGKGWFTASVIIGFLLFFGAIGQAANNPGVDTGGGVSMWLPAVLALIARIRVRSED